MTGVSALHTFYLRHQSTPLGASARIMSVNNDPASDSTVNAMTSPSAAVKGQPSTGPSVKPRAVSYDFQSQRRPLSSFVHGSTPTRSRGLKTEKTALCNYAVDGLIKEYEQTNNVIIGSFAHLYKNTLPDSLLRKTVLVTYLCTPAQIETVLEKHPQSFLDCPRISIRLYQGAA